MNKHKRGFTSRSHPEPALLPLRAALKGCYSGSNKTISGSSRIFNKGFTLLEVLVVVLIIGVLAAVAVPQYQKAVLKSRYSALMPIGKAIAEGNEVYYMEHGAYASLPTQLDVSGQSDKYPDGTQVSMPQEEESLSYVLVTNDSVPNARYLVYQKHSPSFAGTTMCEAGDDKANELCIALGGVTLSGGGNSLGSADWTAYLLSGDATGSNFCPAGATCDENGNITECPSGKTPKEGKCSACDIANAASCSTTSYAAASCNEGYKVSNAGTCEVDPNYPKLQEVKNTKCPTGGSQYVCTIKNGHVYRCDTNSGKIDEGTGECVSNGQTSGYYERIYDADGHEVGSHWCGGTSEGHCYMGENKIPTEDGYEQNRRSCADKGEFTKEGVCSNGYDASGNNDGSIVSNNLTISQYTCSAADISTTTGQCNKYTAMTSNEATRYSTNGNVSYISKSCTTASSSNPSTCSNQADFRPTYSTQWNEAGTAYKRVGCYGGGTTWRALQSDGTCRSGYSLASYDSATNRTTGCSSVANVNWETATCN